LGLGGRRGSRKKSRNRNTGGTVHLSASTDNCEERRNGKGRVANEEWKGIIVPEFTVKRGSLA